MTWPWAIVILGVLTFLAYFIPKLTNHYRDYKYIEMRHERAIADAAQRIIDRILTVPGPLSQAMESYIRTKK